MKIDYLIIGQGLAGSLLAWQLLDRGRRILVVDRDETSTSSKVAAGLVTPVAGSGFTFPAELKTRLNYALKFYWDLEEKTGSVLFHHLRTARLFRDERETERWHAALAADPDELGGATEKLEIDRKLFLAPHGGFEMKQSGWLDVPAFLEVTRQALLERASYAIARVDSGEVVPFTGGVRWKNIEASRVVFAEGWRAPQNRFFDWLKMHPAVGDILDVEIPEIASEERMVNKGGWLLPLGQGRFRAGSTYRHDSGDPIPTPEGKEMVIEKVRQITPHPVAVHGHLAATRPIIRRSQVFAGIHPEVESVGLFNGLGSKGVLNGPWHASRFADFLTEGNPLPAECDLRLHLL